MLSTSAFNALLKTLEEPPPQVLFVFATTEPQKIPDTILSRCQRFDFRQISDDQIAAHLAKVVKAEKIGIGGPALSLIARQADGSLRDALSLLDQVVAFAGETASDAEVIGVLGLTDRSLIARSLEALVRHDPVESLAVLQEVLEKGFDSKTYLLEIWERVRDLLVLRSGAPEDLVRATPDELARMKGWLPELDERELERWFDLLKSALGEVGRAEFPRFLLEVAFLKMTRVETRFPLAQLADRLELLESRLSGKESPARPVATQAPRTVPPVPRPETPPASRSVLPGDWEKLLESVKRQKPSFAAVRFWVRRTRSTSGRSRGLPLPRNRRDRWTGRASGRPWKTRPCRRPCRSSRPRSKRSSR
jgi:DNA polymerase-3 subunit gamma/tau